MSQCDPLCLLLRFCLARRLCRHLLLNFVLDVRLLQLLSVLELLEYFALNLEPLLNLLLLGPPH